MNNYNNFLAASGSDGSAFGEPREPGARRKKLAGYLKAANELRQTYSQSYREAWSGRREPDEYTAHMPGAFPGSAVADTGEEQLVIFPSYAKRHIQQSQQRSRSSAWSIDDTSDQDYWQQQWNQLEDKNAVVDVDVHGWVYAPHRGPPTRKHRLLVGLARQLSGIPAPRQSPSSSTASSRASSPKRFTDRVEAHQTRKEDELMKHEASEIVRRGEAEAAIAGEGAYSEGSDRRYTQGHVQDSRPVVATRQGSPLRNTDLARTSSHLQPATSASTMEMNEAELATANTHLLTRLQPFLANPICNIPISAFFYNDTVSRQKSVETDASGHFTLRAALDFVPTHVRVLASEHLSSTQEIQITEPGGVSIISDIDDTVKHSAIGSGAKEIFKNVFVREFADLSVKGVKEWYAELASLGCFFHYVSNSPWQLYPLLTSFFSVAGLPPGSFHLKQYSGMLQGIFEPVAERKRGTLQKLLEDFPRRRFLLVGDSGEADLEVYTDVALEHPGRILGIYIRDVTTTTKHRFFDAAQSAADTWGSSPPSTSDGLYDATIFLPDEGRARAKVPTKEQDEIEEAMRRSLADQVRTRHEEPKPKLPPRRPTAPAAVEEDLIDLNFDTKSSGPSPQIADSYGNTRTPSIVQSKENVKRKLAPPRPSKPSTAVNFRQGNLESSPGDKPANVETDSRGYYKVRDGQADDQAFANVIKKRDPPVPPPARRENAKQATKGAELHTNAANTHEQELTGRYHSTVHPQSRLDYEQDPQMNRKEEAWNRRWKRAKDLLEKKGTVLRSWRVGEDVRTDSARLIKRALYANADRNP